MITPGPWVADGVVVEGFYDVRPGDRRSFKIATCAGAPYVGEQAAISNARLLAAAPELLAALKAMLAPVGLGERMPPKQRTAELAKRAEVARAAIARAEGAP